LLEWYLQPYRMNSFFSSGWGNSAFHSRGNSGYHFQHRSPKGEGTRLNEVWAMDFVSDALFNGRRIRALTVVDTFSREALAINVGTKLTGLDVIDTLEEIAKERGLPERIKSDNGT
jgi:putative transposase